ncbi:MAG: hypothetical protein IKX71_06865 [Bacteroidales bacterium]|nr:hypothetical protein [Bacteroidales bacterium]
MYEIEQDVKMLIQESLMKRIYRIGNLDNIYDNNALISRWITDIMALGFNDTDVNTAAKDIFELQEPLVGNQSMEDLRARLYLSLNRFTDEVMAFKEYVDNRDVMSDDEIIKTVQSLLDGVEPGEFMIA